MAERSIRQERSLPFGCHMTPIGHLHRIQVSLHLAQMGLFRLYAHSIRDRIDPASADDDIASDVIRNHKKNTKPITFS
jgi:hypothetical protein